MASWTSASGVGAMLLLSLGVCACDPEGSPTGADTADETITTSNDVVVDTELSTSSATVADTDVGDTVSQDAQDSDPVVDTVEEIEEPPLPPPLSFFYDKQAQALAARHKACGLPSQVEVSVPPGLVEHLTTAIEYEQHLACLDALAGLPCASAVLAHGGLADVGPCLFHEPQVYDALDAPAECPFVVDGFTFDVRRQRLSLHNAYWMLYLSILSTLDTSAAAAAALAPLGYFEATITTKNRMQVLYAEHDDHVVLAFKGSTGFGDYFSNATYMMIGKADTGLPGKVHKGFFDTMDSGWPALLGVIQKAFATGKPVVFTGHSLGGAVAQLAALKVHDKKGLTATSLYLFATPRVGNQVFADAYVDVYGPVSFRINNGMDITPRMPPAAGTEQVAKEAILSLFGEGGLGIDILSGILDLCLELADYTQAGGEFWIDPQGYLQGLAEDEIALDTEYWSIATAMFEGWSVAEVTASLPVFHDDDTHLCYQARLIDQLIYERD